MLRRFACEVFETKDINLIRRRADKADALRFAVLDKCWVFAQEAVAWMNGVGVFCLCDLKDFCLIEIGI